MGKEGKGAKTIASALESQRSNGREDAIPVPSAPKGGRSLGHLPACAVSAKRRQIVGPPSGRQPP